MKENIENLISGLFTFIKWTAIAVTTGVAVGLFGILFGKSINFVTSFRSENLWIIYLLPLAGVFIVALHRLLKYEDNAGTNIVISNLHAGEDIPVRMAPLIFISTVMTHMFGGSAGREGAALQLGGSLGNIIGKAFRLDENDRRMVVMCGMSAAFSALFGTPMAAAIFSMEVGSVGIMHYSALVPCVFSALVAMRFAVNMGIRPESFEVPKIPAVNAANVTKIVLICIACAFVSAIFCVILHRTGSLLKKYIKNSYLRVIAGALVVIAAAKILDTTDYLGAGTDVIERAFEGDVVPYAFILKMVLTAVTLGAGFKGGEIVPTFFVGATLGATLGQILGLPSAFCAALGMTALFCGATNCPIATILISFEMFGYDGAAFYMMAVAISYLLSGYYGLYKEQRIVYSKTKTKFVNRNTK